MATILPHPQFSGPQARVTIEAVVAETTVMPEPAKAGNAGIASTTGGSALLVAALTVLTGGLVLGGRRVTAR